MFEAFVEPCEVLVCLKHLWNPVWSLFIWSICGTVWVPCLFEAFVEPCVVLVCLKHLWYPARSLFVWSTCGTLRGPCLFEALVEPCEVLVCLKHLWNPARSLFVWSICGTLRGPCLFEAFVEPCEVLVCLKHLWNPVRSLFVWTFVEPCEVLVCLKHFSCQALVCGTRAYSIPSCVTSWIYSWKGGWKLQFGSLFLLLLLHLLFGKMREIYKYIPKKCKPPLLGSTHHSSFSDGWMYGIQVKYRNLAWNYSHACNITAMNGCKLSESSTHCIEIYLETTLMPVTSQQWMVASYPSQAPSV